MSAAKPISRGAGGGGLLSGLFGGAFADGAAFSGGRVTAFAAGGIVSRATAFGMQGGLGIMGEAGPEAIMPLTRGPGGKLGVAAHGGGGGSRVEVVVTSGQMFDAKVRQIAGPVSVDIVKRYDREVLPVNTKQRNPRDRG